MSKITREERIKSRATLYINGDIDLEDFYKLELLDNQVEEDVEELKEEEEKKNLSSYEDKSKEKTPINKMTKEEFNSLPLMEQQKLYDENPESIRRLLSKFGVVTVEDFKNMSIVEQNKLFASDPILYNRLAEEYIQLCQTT